MSRIALLSETVASQVAAGEVVERPASVVKELVENSLDAGATQVEVAMRRGGISLLRVVDDGMGMDRDDALLSLERHATSKIRSGDDLAAIRTLGFRGEALPSIASVCRFRMATRERGALVGTEILVNGGTLETVRDGGEAHGTQIEVRSLFYNLPARRKFLRTEATEAHHVEHQLHLQAIGHHQVGFTLVQDERTVYHLPPSKSLAQRVRDLCGASLADALLEVPPWEQEGLRIHGFIGQAGVSRSSRQQQLIFLNGRAVENAILNVGLREGYHTALMKGQYPVTFLFIEMDPAAVDVNVHPAKREVRFRDGHGVRDAITAAVRRALEGGRQTWEDAFRARSTPLPAPLPAREHHVEVPLIPEHEQRALRHDWAEFAPPPVLPSSPAPVASTPEPPPQPETSIAPTEPLPEEMPAPRATTTPDQFKILGVLGKLYVLMENAGGLVLVDQHAAHERILFEQMRRRMENEGVPTQRLLIPLTLEVQPKDADWITRHLPVLHRAGLVVEPFGPGVFKLDTLPTFLKAEDPAQLLRDVIDELQETGAQSSKLRLGEDMIAKTVCRHAVKANDVLREPELARLVQDLLECDLPYCCPHGRPTMIQISYGELEKKFGRKV